MINNSIPIETNVTLPIALVAYQDNIDNVVEPSPSTSWMEEKDPYVLPALAVESSHSHDCLDGYFSVK